VSVAVVIPNRDGGEVLERCLDAALPARGLDEVVVVDDGSTDGSDERAARRVRVERSPGRGFAAAANHGARRTSAELVLLLNSDAFLREDTVERLAARFAERPRLGLCGAALVHEDGSRAKTRDRALTLANAVRLAASLRLPPLPDGEGFEPAGFVPLACAAARRSAWDEAGGLDERFRFYFEDHDLCRRLAAAGWEVGVSWDAEAVHLEGGSSRARDPAGWFVQYQRSRLAYLRKSWPAGWPLYLAVWTPSAAAHSALWLARALGRRDRRALAWSGAYLRSALPF
jgi:GT2 family glycosyltransferase